MTRRGGLAAFALVLGACRALADGADVHHHDAVLGVALTLPAGWRLGIASPRTQERARDVGQPADNPRYQDVPVDRRRRRESQAVIELRLSN